MTHRVHEVDWEQVGEGRSGNLEPAVCRCGWRSHTSFTTASASWWAVWARHLDAELHDLNKKMRR